MHNHDEFSVEKKEPSVGKIALWGVWVAIFFFGSALIVKEVFEFFYEQEFQKKVLSISNEQRRLKIEQEERILSGKPLGADEVKHKVIPINTGIELTARSYSTKGHRVQK